MKKKRRNLERRSGNWVRGIKLWKVKKDWDLGVRKFVEGVGLIPDYDISNLRLLVEVGLRFL